MVDLRKKAMSLYFPLTKSEKKDAAKAIRCLDRALTNVRGILDRNDPKVKELVHACDFASTVLGPNF